MNALPPNTPRPPTPRQLQLLRFVHDYTRQHGCPPTYLEMRKELGVQSKNDIWRLLDELKKKGWVASVHGQARSLIILHDMPPIGIHCPHCGGSL